MVFFFLVVKLWGFKGDAQGQQPIEVKVSLSPGESQPPGADVGTVITALLVKGKA